MGKRKIKNCILILIIAMVIIISLTVLTEYAFIKTGAYHAIDEDRTDLFSNHKVMIFAPHQDDEVNILGGVMEEYINSGSEVYVVFTTNGDARHTVEKRLSEALKSESMVGIDEDHVILLGYGDEWNDCGPNIYLADPDTRLISQAGYMETHGTSTHPAFNDNNPYTKNNYISDIKSVIMTYEPDIIFCCDYDPHSDHRVCSMLFEQAMGQILKDNKDYKPRIYKSMAYDTAYLAEKDFYELNLASTKNPFDTDYTQPSRQYYWADRVRIPVNPGSLSRSLLGTLTYWQLRQYESQGADNFAEGIINGDKVFWERRTDSVSYSADVSSALLNDFKIVDSTDLSGYSIPTAGVCTDAEYKMAFDEPVDILEIWLYDNPLPNSNITDALITFDNGNTYHTGKLDVNGNATVISVNEKKCKSFTIEVLSSEGEYAGLTEIEAYSETYKNALSFIKLTDESENFVYDYILDGTDTCRLMVYTSGDASSENIVSNFPIDNNEIVVTCPKGDTVTVSVQTEDGNYKDTVVVSNPYYVGFLKFGQEFESKLLNAYISILQTVYR